MNVLFLMAGGIGWGQAGELPAILVFALFSLWMAESRFHTQGGNDESPKTI